MPSLVAGEDGYQIGFVLRCLRTQKDVRQKGGQVGADLSPMLYGYSVRGLGFLFSRRSHRNAVVAEVFLHIADGIVTEVKDTCGEDGVCFAFI